MRFRVGFALLAALAPVGSLWACGSDPTTTPAVDAGPDVTSKPRDAGHDVADTAPPPYVPQGVRCTRAPDASPPDAWSPPASDAGTDDSSTDASSDGAAYVPALPFVVAPKGLVAPLPVFVPITFDVDDLRPQIEDFLASVGCTSWWHAVASDYGIADAISGPVIHVSEPEPPSITDNQIQQWLRKRIADPNFPQPTPSTVYAIFYPADTTITTPFGKGCFSFGAYHSWFVDQNQWVSYAVMPRCGDMGTLSQATSHELIESVTDPSPGGYQSVGDDDLAWALFGGSEVGDMCEHTATANYQPSDYPFSLQRSWSNKSAFLGHDPCLPSDSTNWFVAAPVLRDTVTVNYYGTPIQTRGLKLASGEQTTIDLQMLADGPAPAWSVFAQDLSQWTVGKTYLKFSFDKTIGQKGDVLHLTISRSGTNASYGAEPFFIRSFAGSGEHLWFGVVGD